MDKTDQSVSKVDCSFQGCGQSSVGQGRTRRIYHSPNFQGFDIGRSNMHSRRLTLAESSETGSKVTHEGILMEHGSDTGRRQIAGSL